MGVIVTIRGPVPYLLSKSQSCFLIWLQNPTWTNVRLFIVFIWPKITCIHFSAEMWLCLIIGAALHTQLGLLYNMQYMYNIPFLKCEKLWILKHLTPRVQKKPLQMGSINTLLWIKRLPLLWMGPCVTVT